MRVFALLLLAVLAACGADGEPERPGGAEITDQRLGEL